MNNLIDWLRAHLMVLDEGEAPNFEVIKESVCDVVESAISETEGSETYEGLAAAVDQLKRAYEGRAGTGSKLR